MATYESAHEKALLEAWIGEHKGIQTVNIYESGLLTGSKWQQNRVWASSVERQFTLPNDSSVVIFKTGEWQHRSHIGYTVHNGKGIGTLILYLDTLRMPLEERPR